MPLFIQVTRRPVQAFAERARLFSVSTPDPLKLDQAYDDVFCLRT